MTREDRRAGVAIRVSILVVSYAPTISLGLPPHTGRWTRLGCRTARPRIRLPEASNLEIDSTLGLCYD